MRRRRRRSIPGAPIDDERFVVGDRVDENHFRVEAKTGADALLDHGRDLRVTGNDLAAQRVPVVLTVDDKPEALHAGNAADRSLRLARVEEHPAHLHRLAYPAEPADEPGRRPAARTRLRHERREVAGAEADERILGRENSNHDLALTPI